MPTYTFSPTLPVYFIAQGNVFTLIDEKMTVVRLYSCQ